MPVIDKTGNEDDEDYIISRAKEAHKYNIYSAKAWMLTAKTLFPTNFKIQFEAYLMEKQSGNVQEAAECFSSLMMSRQNLPELLPEIYAIANALKSSEPSFLSQMFDYICPDIQLTILKTSVENSDDTMEHCRLLVLLLKKFPQLGVDSLVKTLITAENFFYDNRYARLLVVETLPLLTSLESPRLLQRLVVKAIDFYNSYVYDDTEHDITDPWQRLYGILDLLGRQLAWDSYLVNYSNSLNKESYFQKLLSLRNSEDCRQLLYCGVVFFLRSLYEHKSLKGNHILVEALSDPEMPPSKRRKGDIEVTGVSAHQFQAAANCWELLHSNDVISREFMKLTSQLQVKPWLKGFADELALYRGRYDEAVPAPGLNVSPEYYIVIYITKVSINFFQQNYQACIENILAALPFLPSVEGVLESDLIVGGKHRHLHFLPLTKVAIMHYFCSLLIRILMKAGNNSDMTYGHMLVLMQLGWPQEEAMFIQIMDAIKNKGVFHYHLFTAYIIHIDILEELSFIWNEQGKNLALDILPNSQHLGQRRIGTRGADKEVKEDFKQAMKAQVARNNESLLNLIIQFITSERTFFLQLQ
ncbi:integrator complex subunit 10 [Danaus plexippus]|uniref:Integrator complex subunit 10 n=1 Tax=Danaus plexippus plexippus TaxID=278856 RepID=A0A212ELR1_DANPL|nr:integrator complex subunit 10 [Danaus plexippus]OWR42425.1 putative integrator complex subunit 10 isoform 1 [Danaus plexippus plexippus]